MFFGKYFCHKCRVIRKRSQVAYCSEDHGIAVLYWHRCRYCGERVDKLDNVIQDVLAKFYENRS